MNFFKMILGIKGIQVDRVDWQDQSLHIHLLNENLSRPMVSLIDSHYPDSSQVALLGLERASDTAIWAYARQHDFIIVTKDSDFVDLSTLYG